MSDKRISILGLNHNLFSTFGEKSFITLHRLLLFPSGSLSVINMAHGARGDAAQQQTDSHTKFVTLKEDPL